MDCPFGGREGYAPPSINVFTASHTQIHTSSIDAASLELCASTTCRLYWTIDQVGIQVRTVSKKLVDKLTSRIRSHAAVAMDECVVLEAACVSLVIECTPMVRWSKSVPHKCIPSLDRRSVGPSRVARLSTNLTGGCCSVCLMGPFRANLPFVVFTPGTRCLDDCEGLVVALGLRCRLRSLQLVNGMSIRVVGLSSCSS